MRLTYIGPIDRVVVPLPLGGSVECDQGGDCDVPDSHAALLLEQPSNWQRASKPKAAAKPAEDDKNDAKVSAPKDQPA